MTMKNTLFSILILFLLTGCDSLQSYVPGLEPTRTTTQLVTPDPEPTASSTPAASETSTPVVVLLWSVCTGVERGSLNVRSCAGTGCGVVAMLGEGEAVGLTSAREATGSGDWILISSPRQGWVNERSASLTPKCRGFPPPNGARDQLRSFGFMKG